MTIITAISDGKNIWLGNNSALTIGDTPVEGNFDPWFKFEDWALGITGQSFQQDFLESNLKELEKNNHSALGLMQNIRALFLKNDISINQDNSASPTFGIWSILANKTNGTIWDVDDRLSLTQISKNKLWASGSGVDYALGADFAMIESGADLTLQERIRIATEAAIANDITCPGQAVVSQFA